MVARIFLISLFAFFTLPASAREIDGKNILKSKYGNRTVTIDYDVVDFDYLQINPDARVLVTLDKPVDANSYMAGKIFARAFRSEFANSVFDPQKEDYSGYDYVLFVAVSRIADSSTSSVPEYSNESTGVDCRTSYSGKISCRETGNKRIRSGSREVETTLALYGVSASLYSAVSEKELRSTRSNVVFFGNDNCHNTNNVYMSLSHILGLNTFSPEPDKVEFKLYPNMLGCHDDEDIVLTP